MTHLVTHHRVEWGETDAAAIVYFPNYFRWFDGATHRLFEVAGYPVSRMMKSGFATPVIEARTRFFTSLFYEDEIEIRTSVGEIRTRALRMEHTILRNGQPVAQGHDVRMWVRLGGHGEALTAEALPSDFRSLLERFRDAG